MATGRRPVVGGRTARGPPRRHDRRWTGCIVDALIAGLRRVATWDCPDAATIFFAFANQTHSFDSQQTRPVVTEPLCTGIYAGKAHFYVTARNQSNAVSKLTFVSCTVDSSRWIRTIRHCGYEPDKFAKAPRARFGGVAPKYGRRDSRRPLRVSARPDVTRVVSHLSKRSKDAKRSSPMPNIDMTLPALLRHRAETIGDSRLHLHGRRGPRNRSPGEPHLEPAVPAGAGAGRELRRTATTGDRVAIVAPQALDYVVAFYASLQAGLIAVPLSVPMSGVHDQRVESTLEIAPRRSCSPPPRRRRRQQVRQRSRRPAGAHRARGRPDRLDITRQLDTTDHSRPGPAYLQYTSGSTRTPAGVVVTHRNVVSNVEQIICDYFAEHGGVLPADTIGRVVAAVLSRHGPHHGICSPLVGAARAC